MNRFPMLVLLSLYMTTCRELNDTDCWVLEQVKAPALYTGEVDVDDSKSGIDNFVLEVQTTDRAVLSWTDAEGAYTATYTISIE